MNRAVTVMSNSADERCHDDRHSNSMPTALHTNFSLSYDPPVNVAQHQSSYDYPPGCTPASSMQIPNLVAPNSDLFSNECPRVSCQPVLPDKPWYHVPKVDRTSCCAVSTDVASEPVVQTVAPTQVLLPTLPSPVDGDGSSSCDGANKDCDSAYTGNNSGMPTVDPRKASFSSSSANSTASSVVSMAVSGSDGKADVQTSVAGNEVTVATSSSAGPVTLRPKCGRAKTNAELKRQLMERREQRLRDMLDSSAESTVPSCTSTGDASTSACKQPEASTVMVSYTKTLIWHCCHTG